MQTVQNVTDIVLLSASERPDAVALVDQGANVTYAELGRLVSSTAVYLRDLGIQSADRIALALTNSREHAVLTLAIMRVGATLIEASVADSIDQLAALAEKYKIRVLFTEGNVPPPPSSKTTFIQITTTWLAAITRTSGDACSNKDLSDLQVITLSSGSTGVPRGVVTTHEQLLKRFDAQRDLFAQHGVLVGSNPATFLLTSSLRNALFFRYFLAQMLIGGTTVLLPEFLRPIELVRAIHSWQDGFALVVPNMGRFFLSIAPKEGVLFPSIRALICGGQPLYEEEKRRILACVTPNFYETYGTSGAGVIACLGPEDMTAKRKSVGKPVPGVELDVVDDNAKSVDAGTIGRLRIRGPAISSGYAPEDTKTGSESYADGWYYPGELASIDRDGFVYIHARSNDVILRGRFNIFPTDVEAAIARHPTVQDVSVVGVPVPGVGERVAAFVVRRTTERRDDLAAYCRRLPAHIQPDWIHFMDALPRLAGGKVDRMKLKAIAEREAQRRAQPSAPSDSPSSSPPVGRQ